MVIGFETPNGYQAPGTVVEIGAREVIINFSHPLAGQDLVFEVEVIDVKLPEKCLPP